MRAKSPALLFICLLATSAAFGQVVMGPTFGGNLLGKTPDIRVALPVIVTLGDFLEVQGELGWSNRYNPRFIRKLDVDPKNYSCYVSYTELGVMLRPSLKTGQGAVYIMAGPSIGYGRRVHFRYLEKNQIHYQETSLSELELKEWDAGIQTGIGLSKTLLNDVRLQIEYRLYYGVTDLEMRENQSIFNQSQYLSMGFLFLIGQ